MLNRLSTDYQIAKTVKLEIDQLNAMMVTYRPANELVMLTLLFVFLAGSVYERCFEETAEGKQRRRETKVTRQALDTRDTEAKRG